MRKYVLIPDSFKGTLSSREVCQIVAEAIRSQEPEAEICAIPVADGGEGTVDAFLSAVGGQQVPVACTGPYGEAITACYGLLPDGSAVVEMAAAAGLPMVGENRNPEKTTTYGVGQLIRHAAHHGAKRLVLALGGSATNERGCRRGRKILPCDGRELRPRGRYIEGYSPHRHERHGSGGAEYPHSDHVRH